MKKIIILILFVFLSITTMSSRKLKNVSASYTLYASESMSLEEAKRVAIERAKIQAIAEEFGTTVSQSNSTIVKNTDGKSETQFLSIGNSNVKGEWIKDIKSPEVLISYIDNTLVVTANVSGEIRESKFAEYQLSVQILRNGFEGERFFDKDRFSVRFRTPVSGYLSIWLSDDNMRKVYCLLPYSNADGKAREVKKGLEYTFLSTEDKEYPFREETILTAQNGKEINRLILLFSTNIFTMPLTVDGDFVPELSNNKFEKWLQNIRLKDEEMCIIERMIEISADEN